MLARLTSDIRWHHLEELDKEAPEELRTEIARATGGTVLQSAFNSVEMSEEALVALENDQVLCLTGVVPPSEQAPEALVWMLPTKLLLQKPRALLQGTRAILDRWSKNHDPLVNYIDAEWPASIHWAQHCGFEVSDELARIGPSGYPFIKVIYRRK